MCGNVLKGDVLWQSFGAGPSFDLSPRELMFDKKLLSFFSGDFDVQHLVLRCQSEL